MRTKKLSNQFMLEFSSLLYTINIVLSNDLKENRINELQDFSSKRLMRNISYFAKNDLIKSSLEFLKFTIDFL